MVEIHLFLISCDGVVEEVSTDRSCIVTVGCAAGPGSGSSLLSSEGLEIVAGVIVTVIL